MRHFDSTVEYREFVVDLYERNQEADGSDEYTIAKAVLANGEVVNGEVAMLTTAEPWADERICPVEVLCNSSQDLDQQLINENQLWAAAVKALAEDLRSLDTVADRIWQ